MSTPTSKRTFCVAAASRALFLCGTLCTFAACTGAELGPQSTGGDNAANLSADPPPPINWDRHYLVQVDRLVVSPTRLDASGNEEPWDLPDDLDTVGATAGTAPDPYVCLIPHRDPSQVYCSAPSACLDQPDCAGLWRTPFLRDTLRGGVAQISGADLADGVDIEVYDSDPLSLANDRMGGMSTVINLNTPVAIGAFDYVVALNLSFVELQR